MKKIYLILLAILPGFSLSTFAQTYTFSCPTTTATWTVPAGVTSIQVDMQGATGGQNSIENFIGLPYCIDSGGHGARVQATLAVVPGQVLNIYVGGAGPLGITGSIVPGGFNGGGGGKYAPGAGITPNICGGGGGGASDIRIGGIALSNRVMVAGGGGGAGGNYCTFSWPGIFNYEKGGDGGTTTGEAGWSGNVVGAAGAGGGGSPGGGGGGGTSLGFGLGAGVAGVAGIGGDGGTNSAGGGGGGGYYGGGGACYCGGGGGSSFADPAFCTSVTHTRGYNASGCGTVTICLTDPGVISGMKPVCSGQTLTLTDSKPGGIWSSSNTNIATVDPTGVVTGKLGGVVTISYSLTTPCATAYAVASITVIDAPVPIVGSSIVCVDGTPMLSDATPGGAWSIDNTAVATINPSSGVVTGIYPGSATVTYSIPPAGCSVIFPVDVVGIAGPHSVCAGSTVTLILPVGGGGAWTSSNTSVASVDPAGVVTGVSIGTSTISYSSALCPESIVMQVNPIAPVIGADSICVAGSAYYTDIVGIGSWSSSNTSVASVSGLPGLVTGVGAGTAIISFSTPAGCLAQDTVMVIALPPAITGTTHVCVEATTALHNSLPGGVWSSIDPTTATINAAGVVTGMTPDTTSILYTIRPGCSAAANILVNPLPLPITGIDTICPGVIDTFSDASRGGLWSTSTPTQDTIVDTTGILTSRLSGNGVISYTLPTGCTISKAINIYPVPTPLITYNKFDNTMYTDPIYVAYQWYDSISGKVPHAVSPSLAGVYNEWFYVVVTDTNGCKSPSAKFYFNNGITGVSNTSDIRVKIFPNPVTGRLYIESPVRVRAVITGIDGKTELDQSDAKELDISRLASGIYLISLYDDGGAVLTVQKIIKE